MTMIVYHGSDSNFKKLRIAKSLVKHESTFENEGIGIYYSTDKEIARSYGKYLYTLEIHDDKYTNFKKRKECEKYVLNMMKEVQAKCNVNLNQYLSADMITQTIDRMYLGGLAISGVGKELCLLLDSTCDWYLNLSVSKTEQVYRVLRNYGKSHLAAYDFNYHIRNIGIIKNVDPDIVKIVDKEYSY